MIGFPILKGEHIEDPKQNCPALAADGAGAPNARADGLAISRARANEAGGNATQAQRADDCRG